MIDFPATLVEPGIGFWRSAYLDDEGFPASLTFHEDTRLSRMGAIFAARVTGLNTASDMAFLALGRDENGAEITGMLNLRRAKQLVAGKASSISDCVQEGQRLMVQVVTEPGSLDDKALTLTARPRLDAHYVSVETGKGRLNVSKDVPPAVKHHLSEKLQDVTARCAVIVRASAAHARTEHIVREAEALAAILAMSIEREGLLFSPSIEQKVLLALRSSSGPAYIMGGAALARLKQIAQKDCPDLLERLIPYKGRGSAFEAYGVEEAIDEALMDEIALPSGGWISIHETRALTAIDVNLGRALQGRSAADAKIVTNMEAALAIAHHLRFQDIGGLIVIDFVEMSTKGAIAKLLALLDEATRQDTAQIRRGGVSAFGLLEMSRQRKGVSLRDRLRVSPAPVPRASYQAAILLNQALRLGETKEKGDLTVSAPAPVLDWLERHPQMGEDLKERTGRALWLVPGAPEVYLS